MLGILMPDPELKMFNFDPISGLSYVSGGIMHAHHIQIDTSLYRLFCTFEQAKDLSPLQRTQSLSMIDSELYEVLDGYHPSDRIKQYDALYEMSYQYKMGIIQRMLENLS